MGKTPVDHQILGYHIFETNHMANLTHVSSGWWYTYHSKKYESQLGLFFPIYGKIEFMFQTTNQSWHFEWPQTFWQGSDD